MFFIAQQKRTAPPGVDAAETVRFSWKVVELAWLLDATDGVCKRPRHDEKHLATFL